MKLNIDNGLLEDWIYKDIETFRLYMHVVLSISQRTQYITTIKDLCYKLRITRQQYTTNIQKLIKLSLVTVTTTRKSTQFELLGASIKTSNQQTINKRSTSKPKLSELYNNLDDLIDIVENAVDIEGVVTCFALFKGKDKSKRGIEWWVAKEIKKLNKAIPNVNLEKIKNITIDCAIRDYQAIFDTDKKISAKGGRDYSNFAEELAQSYHEAKEVLENL